MVEEISQQETHLLTVSQPRIVRSISYLLDLVGTYSITIINVVIAVFAVLKIALALLFHKKEPKNDVFWISLVIPAGIFGVSMKYGGYEAIQRGFMFMLLPACYFSVKFLSKKLRILILVLIILIFIHIPADYSSEVYTMVPTSEFEGAAFYAEYIPPAASFFYSLPISYYKNIEGKHAQKYIRSRFHSLPSHEFVTETVGQAAFLMSSDLQRNYYLYFWGFDPLEDLSLDDHCNRMYDSEGFHIYARNKPDR